MADRRPEPLTRLRSRHRLFDQHRADRSRLQGSLVVDASVLAGAAVWWSTGQWQVAVAWAAASLIAALWSIHDHRRGPGVDGVEERCRLKGLPGPASIGVTVGMGVVLAVTLRFGVGWGWGEALFLPSTSALVSLAFAWRSARRDRTFVSERRREI